MESLRNSLYRKLYLIRAAEREIIEHYGEDEMKTPMHMSMGEEGIVCGVIEALGPRGQALGTFRSHALYLAMTGETDAFFCELYGKEGGIADGKAGSMHLSSPGHGLWSTSAIVASTIPASIGVAFANKVKRNGAVTACFFGDGSTEEGVFWETLNVACVMRLPVLFVYEDNGLSIHARPPVRRGYDSFREVVRQYRCLVSDTGDTTDAEEIHDRTAVLLRQMAEQERPGVLCTRYYRYLEHVGTHFDFDRGYRDRAEYERWRGRDPVEGFRAKLRPEDAAAIEAQIDAMVRRSRQEAEAAPFPTAEKLMEGVMA